MRDRMRRQQARDGFHARSSAVRYKPDLGNDRAHHLMAITAVLPSRRRWR